MRPEVERLVRLGPFPDEVSASIDDVQQREALIASIDPPLTDEEARGLTGVLGQAEDSCFGLKWGIVRLVESAPGWPLPDVRTAESPWVRFLAERAARGPGDVPAR